MSAIDLIVRHPAAQAMAWARLLEQIVAQQPLDAATQQPFFTRPGGATRVISEW